MSGPNRKVVLEEIEGGQIIVSANFDEHGRFHELRPVEVQDGPTLAAGSAANMLHRYWDKGFMRGDGKVPQKPEWTIKRDAGEDYDVPF